MQMRVGCIETWMRAGRLQDALNKNEVNGDGGLQMNGDVAEHEWTIKHEGAPLMKHVGQS